MKKLRNISRSISLVLVVLMGMLSLNAPAYAGLIGTQAAVEQQQADRDRAALLGLLEREDLRAELQAYGVNPDNARERVAALSDAEVQALSGQIGEIPAGGDVLGVAVLVFLVLLLTDILGYTDIFPFVKKTVN